MEGCRITEGQSLNSESNVPSAVPTLVIRPSRGWLPLNLRELWDYRDLLYFLTWRDIQVRYKQTVLGIAWAVLQPFLKMLVFSIIASLGQLPTDNIPKPIFVYCALLPWQLFEKALTDVSNSLVANQQMITKVYFPRLVIPISIILAGLVDFGVAFPLLLGMMVYYHITPTSAIWALPLLLLLAIAVALGVGAWMCALNVNYRDIRYTVPLLTQLWFFATPGFYDSSIIPQRYQILMGLNPMAGVVNGFRWVLLGTKTGLGPMFWLSVAITVLILVTGLYYFRRMERSFADIV